MMTSPTGDEEINIYLKVTKTVPLKVKQSDTIESVKTLLRREEGVQECLQELVFAGIQLKDDQRLVDFGICQNSSLNVNVHNPKLLKLFVTIPPSTRTIIIEATSLNTIQDIKALIRAKRGIHSDQYVLVYEGKLLEDNKTLEVLNISNESTMRMLFVRSEKLLVSVKMPSGNILDLEVRIWHTVYDLKTLLEKKLGFSVDGWSLLYEGKRLDDSKMLLSYNVEHKSRLELLSPFIQIFISRSNCGTMTLPVLPTDSVRDLKLKISKKAGVPIYFQILDFGGKTLQDFRDLASYNIQRNSTIRLTVWKR